MDWSAIKNKALELKNQGLTLTKKALPYVEKAKEFTEAQFQATPLVLKNQELYEQEKTIKKYLVLFLDNKDDSYGKLMLRYPVFASKSWTMNATLRVVDISSTPDFVANLKIASTPMLIVHYQGSEYKRYIGIQSILEWFKTPCFYDTDPIEGDDITKPLNTTNDTTLDPLHNLK